MMMLKACPRCSGDLLESSDMYGRYVQCIQCGHLADLPSEPLVTADVATATVDDQPAAA